MRFLNDSKRMSRDSDKDLINLIAYVIPYMSLTNSYPIARKQLPASQLTTEEVCTIFDLRIENEHEDLVPSEAYDVPDDLGKQISSIYNQD